VGWILLELVHYLKRNTCIGALFAPALKHHNLSFKENCMKSAMTILGTLLFICSGAMASNLSFMINSLGKSGSIGKGKCSYTIDDQKPLNFKGLQDRPVYSMSITSVDVIQYGKTNGGTGKTNTLRVYLVNEPSLSISQNYLTGNLFADLNMDVLREEEADLIITKLEIYLDEQGHLSYLSGSKQTPNENNKLINVFSCY
jgi:hypothetical protein